MSRNTPVTVKGTNYPSIRAACHALGIPYQTAYIQAKRHCTSIQWELEHSTFNLQPVAVSAPVYEYTSRSGKVYRVKSIPDLKRVIYRDYERGAVPPESITIPVTFRVTRRKSKAGLTYTRSVRGYDHEAE